MVTQLSRRRGLIALGLALLLAAAPLRLWAQTPRAALVVVHGDGRVLTRCVELPAATVSGVELLVASGLDLSLDASGGLGATICRVDAEGCSFPQEQCFCQCQGAPCLYWSYWQRAGDGWRYSSLGASSTTVSDGGIDAWVWNTGTIGRSADREPPNLRFDDVCASAAPEPAPQPTTADPPVIDYFRADYAGIVQGEAVTLRWDLHGAEGAWLRYDGVEEGVMAPGGKPVMPAATTTYVLVARGPGGEVQAQVTVAVVPAPPTATPTAVVAAIATPAPAAVALLPVPQTPEPTATAVPTATPLPTPTPGWTTWQTTPLTGSVAAAPTAPLPTGPAPVIVNPTPASPSKVTGYVDAAGAGRLALSVGAVALPAVLLITLLAARRPR